VTRAISCWLLPFTNHPDWAGCLRVTDALDPACWDVLGGPAGAGGGRPAPPAPHSGSEQAQAWLAETASLPDAAFAAWQDPGITFDHERTLRARAARRRARRSDAALLAAVLALACACAYLGARALDNPVNVYPSKMEWNNAIPNR
jgi:hypothetical protein